jgi:lipopolysaccharide biosynthesis glycosyltransferase
MQKIPNNRIKSVLVTLSDEKYLYMAKQLFASAYINGMWNGDYLLMTYHVPEKKLKWFIKRGIKIYRCRPINYLGTSKYSEVFYSKFNLFKTYFKKWEKIIFLDADIIVKKPLFGMIKHNGFSAANSTTMPLNREFNSNNLRLLKKLNNEIRLKGPAFNTGVMSFDSSIIDNDTFTRLIKLHNKYYEIHMHREESTLNLLFAGKWNVLPTRYNIYPDWIYQKNIMKKEEIKGFILHFMGPLKPSDKKSPFYKEWKQNLLYAETIKDINIMRFKKIKWSLKEEISMRIFELKYHLCYIIDRKLGKLGILLNHINPQLYNYMKKKL